MKERKLEHQYIDFDKDTNLIELPFPTSQFPRYKKIPKALPMTKWEKFAK